MNPLMNNNNSNSNMSIIGKFMEFQKKMQGQNPDKIIKEMLNSGQITQDQLYNAVKTARQLSQFISNR